MNSKEIQRRIKGIKNTKQITKAMEMVAASKMRKACERVLATRPYAYLAWEMLSNLSRRVNPESHPLLQERAIKKIGVILITSDRGLCGAMNTQVIQRAIKIVEEEQNNKTLKQKNKKTLKQEEQKILIPKEVGFSAGINGICQEISISEQENTEIYHTVSGVSEKPEIEFITVGKKGRDFIKKYYKIFAEFTGFESISKIMEITPIVKIAIEDYKKGLYDKIILVYTDFISTLKQEPVVKQLLPIESKKQENSKGTPLGQKTKNFAGAELFRANGIHPIQQFEYKFEPTADEVLEELLPRLLEIQIYQALLESNASEHCARMVAMKNATDAAKDLIDNLTMTFNQVRQANITQEITEISTGAAFSL